MLTYRSDTLDRQVTISDNDDRVPEHDGCPHCGETRVDYLVIDDDHVDCLSCGIGYWLYDTEVK